LQTRPKVNIGLPVFNGQRCLEATIDSVLAQTYPNFELVFSDNASSDRMEEICRRYVEADPRDRYHRQAGNLMV
jgi:glycosyltransferase involved in cell wall biosynthesis